MIATGNLIGGGDSLACEIELDGDETPASAIPGGNTTGEDGFALTYVSGLLPSGDHEVTLACSDPGATDGQLASSSIAVLGITK